MMLKDLKERLLVSLVFVAVVAVLIAFSQREVMRYLVGLIVAALSALGTWEYSQLSKEKGSHIQSFVLMALSALVTFSFYFIGWFSVLPAICLTISVFLLFALHFRDKIGAIVNLAVATFGLVYIAIPLGMILAILYFPHLGDGRMWVAYLLAVTKITDIGAYIGGNLWGRRKLAPHVSPAKTVEGALIGLLFALATSYFFHVLGKDPSWHFSLSNAEWILLGLLLGVVGQFGDLSESLLKRDANKKDSNVLPGMGGALDTVDSLLFNTPIIFFYSVIL